MMTKEDTPLQVSKDLMIEENTNMHKQLSCEHATSISKWEKFKAVLVYFGQDRRPAIITVLIIIMAFCIFVMVSDKYKLSDLLDGYLAPKQFISTIIQLTTFFAIISIWYRTIRKEWRQQLNKYLSVSFTYNNKLRVHCRYAKLSGDSDARGMAQSFAQVLNCKDRIDLAPSLQEITHIIQVDKNEKVGDDPCYLINNGKPFLHYDVVIHLTEDIQILCEKEKEEEKKIILNNNEYLLWDYPFKNDGKLIVEK